MAYIEANNAKFYYESTGTGQPLILISGYASDHSSWALVVESLSKHFRVITFDNRGCGQTTDDGGELSAELMADDVITLAEVLQLEKPHIIGSSMGSTIAQQVAIRHPEKISKLGLIGSTTFWRQRALLSITASLRLREQEVDFETQIDVVLPWLFGQEFLSVANNIKIAKETIMNDPHPQSLIDQQRQFKVLEKFNSNALISQITTRTLVMYGDEDLLSLPYESEYLASQLQDAITHEFSSGHALMFEQPEELCKVIIEFFSDIYQA